MNKECDTSPREYSLSKGFKRRSGFGWFPILTVLALLSPMTGWNHDTALADPCGMVPPAYIEGAVPLERIGLQKTFVFYRDGIETFVIRPGFQGKVEEFGMLIPFPSPPALRKVPDTTFAHIAAAVDPPEIVVDLTPRSRSVLDMEMPSGAMAGDDAAENSLEVSTVRVLKQEAVGMYEVAVLEAGSADALSLWMKDHGYQYPKGMDQVCSDYVQDGWCFVAVKARVGEKSSVEPRPGMQNIDAGLPPGSSFDGHVQGMGFRFRSDELVVPMRLSAFNEGDLHNVVYLLTEGPMKARDMPAGHVVRQISGVDLLHNVTQPLPLRIIGGSYQDIPEHRRQRLKTERDPQPHNGHARSLFAGDLLAAANGVLNHQHEELEKELLNIGERLSLRGKEIDALHGDVLEAAREEIAEAAIQGLKGMTLTVIDGDFDREVVAKDNVYFAKFEINPIRNTPNRYNARMFGPSGSEAGASGVGDALATPVATITIDDPDHGRLILQDSNSTTKSKLLLIATGVLVTVSFVTIVFFRRRSGAAGLILLVCASSIADESSPLSSDIDTVASTEQSASVDVILDELQESSDRNAALGRIHSLGEAAVAPLLSVVDNDTSVARRGWAIVCLKEIGGADVSNGLDDLINRQSLHPLVRTWVAAARIEDVSHAEDLQRFALLCQSLPALRRPLRLKVLAMAKEDKVAPSAETMLKLIASDYELQQSLAPVLLNMDPAALGKVLMVSKDTNLRRAAASWLATQKQNGRKGVNQAVIEAVRFEREAEAPPWGEGPLFLPGVNWNREDATTLISELTAWYAWSAANEQHEQVSKIVTNLNSRLLMQAAGFNSVPNSITDWLVIWEKRIGEEAMQALMTRTGFRFSSAKFEELPE